MFTRQKNTYNLSFLSIDDIFKDSTNPLNRICELIPSEAKVLDIGAGNGLLALMLKSKKKRVIIDGIESDLYAAKIARKYYRNFYQGLAENFTKNIAKENYDFIVLADVIEHINNPLAFLKEITSQVSSSTKIILSVPNIAFGAVRVELLNGDFNYVNSGILEKTHLRFFTFKTLKFLLENTGMNIEKIFFLQKNIFKSEIDLKDYNLNLFSLFSILNDHLSSVYQFILILSKKQSTTEEKYYGEKMSYFDFLLIIVKIYLQRILNQVEKVVQFSK